MTVQFQEVSVNYAGVGHPALDQVSLSFQSGEMVGILGRSGAGKSTLIRCVNGLVRPTSGVVNLNGYDLSRMPERQLRQIRSRIGMVFQSFGLVPRTAVLTNVMLGKVGTRPVWANALGYFSRAERERGMEALRSVELAEFADRRVEQLSGGQQQRVGIARALMQAPTIMLGDEPVSSLDPVTSRDIMELFVRIHREEQRITIVNLHDVELALLYCDRIVGLRQGRVVFDGLPGDVDASVRRDIYGDRA